MTDTLRDNIRTVALKSTSDATVRECTRLADAVLTMPEMLAMRAAWRQYVDEYEWCGPGDRDPHMILADLGVPESVIAWVMSEWTARP